MADEPEKSLLFPIISASECPPITWNMVRDMPDEFRPLTWKMLHLNTPEEIEAFKQRMRDAAVYTDQLDFDHIQDG